MLLNNQWITEEIKGEIKLPRDKSKHNTTIQNLCNAAKAILRGKFIAAQSQETMKIANKQPKLTPNATRERTNKTQS